MPDADPQAPTSSVSDEAARLVAALRGLRADAPPHAPAADQPEAPRATSAAPPHDPACTMCPLCIALRTARAVGPDTVDALADVLTLGVQALRELAAAGRDRARAADERPTPDH